MSEAVTFTDSETEATCSRMVRSKGSAECISTGSETSAKPCATNLDPINSVGQALGVHAAPLVRSECLAILGALADEVNRAALHAQSSGILDRQTQLPSGALGKQGRARGSRAITAVWPRRAKVQNKDRVLNSLIKE